MRTNAIQMLGQRFGRLIVIKGPERPPNRDRDLYWVCQCDCGQTTNPINGYSLRAGLTRSCGCIYKETSPRNLPRKVLA